MGVKPLSATDLQLQTRPGVRIPGRWSWAHYLALIGVPILFWNAWTVIAWLADGPRQVTEFREADSWNFAFVKVLEVSMVIVSVAMLIYVVRGCLRQRRFFTFDVKFCLAGMTIFWSDLGANVFIPTFVISSNFFNFNGPCGHMPLVVNPDCGRAPDPIPFLMLMCSFGLLALAIAFEKGVRWARARWPSLSNRQLLLLIVLTALVFDLVLEAGLFVPLHVWTYPAPGWMSIPTLGDGSTRFPFIQAIIGALFFGLLAALRVFRDDQGRTLVDRGLGGHSPRRATAISLLATYAVFQLLAWGVGNVPLMMYGPYEPVDAWERMPRYLVNDVCDAPRGVEGTRYGPCPGSPGWRIPTRHSLPGSSP